jgi:hypothetical protein
MVKTLEHMGWIDTRHGKCATSSQFHEETAHDIVFIRVVLGQTKTAPAKTELVRIANSTSCQKNKALKMNKYLHPGYFFLGSHQSRHDSGVKLTKELHVLLSRRLSSCLVGQGQMHECHRRQNAPTSHPAGASVVSVPPHHLCRDDVMTRGLPMRGK